MTRQDLLRLLRDFKDGRLGLEQAMSKLEHLPFEDLGFAKIDGHRTLRQGFPEVVYCAGKTTDQVVQIVARLAAREANVLATRANAATFAAVKAAVPEARYNEAARAIVVERQPLAADPDRPIMVLTAGTSDMPVAEEAAVTAAVMGNTVERIYDVGVAGIHRLFAHLPDLERANVVIVVAGMEGALTSVVGGLVDKPVIAVPTSVGYGANFGGLSALLAMLNSCAAGVAVVNIDNGFGAGRLASIINHMR